MTLAVEIILLIFCGISVITFVYVAWRIRPALNLINDVVVDKNYEKIKPMGEYLMDEVVLPKAEQALGLQINRAFASIVKPPTQPQNSRRRQPTESE